jgi:hydrophobe/amphiphile efflux-1 (HAE1) family protein
MKGLADFSIRRPVFAWMLMSALVVFGAISFLRLGVSQMPDVDFPVLDISVSYEGAAPDVIEAELVEPIESRVIAVEGVTEIRSSIRQGSASVRLDFELDRDIDAAIQEVQAALGQLRLPSEVDPPVIRKSNPEEDPILFIGLQSKQPLKETIRFADLVLIDQFQVLPGVGEVGIGGFSVRNLRVWIDNEKLRRNLLTVIDVANAIQQGHSEIAAGVIEDQRRSINVRAMGEGLAPEEIGNIWIRNRGGEIIREPVLQIKDVARVEDGLSDTRRLARINGQDGLAFSIRKQRGSNEVKVAEAVRGKVEELNRTLPEGYQLQINADYTRATEQIVKSTTNKLIMAAVFTGMICFLFLGSWGAALNVLLSIPTSVLGTFIVLYFAGFTLNLFTLLALALAISIVVDDAIMMLENIVRHFKMGKTRRRAASDGAREIWLAAVAATVAVVAIFLPVVFMTGVIGRFFFQFGVTISAAVLLSLLEAITLTPMRCSQMMRPSDDSGWLASHLAKVFSLWADFYRRTLAVALNWRWTVVVGSTLIFVCSLSLFSRVRKEFVPAQDQSLVFVSVQTPPGSSLPATDEAVRKVEEWIKARPEVDKYFASVGLGGPGGGAVNSGFLGVTLVEKDKREIGHIEFMQQLREEFRGRSDMKGVRVNARDSSARGLTSGRSQPVSFNIRGPDYSILKKKKDEIIDRLENTGLVVDLDSDYKEGQPELRLIPDRKRAANFGVSPEAISRTVAAAVGGIRQGQFTNDGRRYDIRISLPPEDRTSADKIGQVQVRNYVSGLVPLAQLVRMEEVSTVQSVTRINRSRAISVFGNLRPGQSQAEALAKAESIAREVLPSGYTFHLEGASRSFEEGFGSLYFALLLGLLVSYMVLASQFNSFIHPITILLALPFSISGAFVALWGFDQSLSLYSMIGILLLMGITKKNSILLVEFTNHTRNENPGRSVREAQLLACPVRLRPILMTSAATVAAALPLAIDLGPGNETRVPMALAIIGGTLVSTVFTLYVVPCAYSLMVRLERPSEID